MEMYRDVFFCHASEDKQNIVIPLVEALKNRGVKCWVDQGEIKWGDSITQKVNDGLKISQYIIVVLSESFLGKPWPERELYAALNTEASLGEVKVLPLLVGDKQVRDRILTQYPLLNDKMYLPWEGKAEPIITAIIDRINIVGKVSTEKENDRSHSNISKRVSLPRIKKEFSDRDRALFLKGAFNEVKGFFQRALIQLNREYTEIDTDFSEVNPFKFISTVYLRGNKICQCKIWIGGAILSGGIAYSEGWINIDQDNSYNELMAVVDDGYNLYLRFSMGALYQLPEKSEHDPISAAELLWSRFITPLK
ncbi:toll/interleukin-1 receptor domain-containing protein [bacterium]|nr:toll/interleukin-1 receptor domain-containing protein [bacterium]